MLILILSSTIHVTIVVPTFYLLSITVARFEISTNMQYNLSKFSWALGDNVDQRLDAGLIYKHAITLKLAKTFSLFFTFLLHVQ